MYNSTYRKCKKKHKFVQLFIRDNTSIGCLITSPSSKILDQDLLPSRIWLPSEPKRAVIFLSGSIGEIDKNVDPASAMQVIEVLAKANKDFDLLVLPGRGRGTGRRP
jgi:hypothetical protein